MALLQTLKQTQNLSLTPQLLQSIKILQLSSSDLKDHLLEEIEQNPVLESETELYRSYSGKSGSFDNNEREEGEASPPSLQETLLSLLMPSLHTEDDKKMGEKLIFSLDEAGYLHETDYDEAVLQLLQEVAPAGIGARSLRECLMLQLKAKNRYDAVIATLLDHLELVAKRDYVALKKICACDDDDLSEMIKDLRDLDPKPGLAFSFDAITPPAPDVIVRLIKGEIIVQLNPDLLPRMSVNKSYIRRFSQNSPYVKEMAAKAYGLLKMLDQRFETLIKVSTEIMKQQEEFIRGKGSLAPMTLKQVAEQCDMHESTVSRAMTGKIAMLPQGVFELKHFFTNAVNEEGLSSDAVRLRIKALIETETKVLSDDDLVLVLKSEGMTIARRTISKYREALGIPSSMLRKREKMLHFR